MRYRQRGKKHCQRYLVAGTEKKGSLMAKPSTRKKSKRPSRYKIFRSKCKCGAGAVDWYKGKFICRDCMCPEMDDREIGDLIRVASSLDWCVLGDMRTA